MPIDLYKAMIIAKQKNLIDGGTSRWDEGLTKAEAIDLLVRAIKQDDSMETFDIIRASIGNMDVEVILDKESEVDGNNSVSVDSTGVNGEFEEDEYTGDIIEEQSTEEQSSGDNQTQEDYKELARKEIKEWLDSGEIDEDEYNELLKIIEEPIGTGSTPSQSSQSSPQASTEVIYDDPTYDPNNPDAWANPEYAGRWSDAVVH